MGTKFQKLTRGAAALAATAAVAALAVAPAHASQIFADDPGSVPTALGSPDARSTVQSGIYLRYGHSADPSSAAVSSTTQRIFLSYGKSDSAAVSSTAPRTFLSYGQSDSAAVSPVAPSYLSYAHAPDTNDPGLGTPVEIVPVASTDTFDWGDFGIGIGACAALMLLAGAAFVSTRAAQHRLRNA
jgi:hypothetical protein